MTGAMLPKGFCQPRVQVSFFPVFGLNQIRLAGQQTLRGGEADKILRRFNLALKVIVFCFDVRDRFRRGVGSAVAHEGGMRRFDVVEKITDGLVERFPRKSRRAEAEQKTTGEKSAH